MKRFEYKLTKPGLQNLDEVEKFFNHLGNDGWELCCVEYGMFIFKREK